MGDFPYCNRLLINHPMKLLFSFFLMLIACLSLSAQISAGGQPMSFEADFQTKYELKEIKTTVIPKINFKQVEREDEANNNNRFTVPVAVEYNLKNAGEWTELENGDWLWRFKVRSKDALALAILYNDFYLPPGAQLYMFSPDHQQVLGAYTFRNNKPTRRFWTGLIKGEEAILEYYEPKAYAGQGRLGIFRIDHAYKPEVKSLTGFGDSYPCHINVNCPEGANWQDQKRSVCRILLVAEEGMGFCSGSLLNNTEEDGTPLVLSAFHCQDGFNPFWDMYRFDFNYEGIDCVNPFEEPSYVSILGSTFRAGRQQTDFVLLELLNNVPTEYDVFFNGWDRRSTVVPQNSTMIHHPRADIKKITFDENFAIIHNANINWDNGVTTLPNTHLRVVWDLGTQEFNSSGAPLFDQAGRVVAQLHGDNGIAGCESIVGYFGRLSTSWEGDGTPDTRLKDWLDPQGILSDTLDGINNPMMGEVATISGFVRTEASTGIADVTVNLVSMTGTESVVTGPDGAYTFTDVPTGASYSLNFEKTGLEQNGVSTLDLIKIRKHILGVELLDSPLKVLASDVNSSENVSTLDLILIQKVILAIDDHFANAPSWRFFPADISFSDPDDPFADFIPPSYDIIDFLAPISDLNFIGVKSGDANGSADPG